MFWRVCFRSFGILPCKDGSLVIEFGETVTWLRSCVLPLPTTPILGDSHIPSPGWSNALSWKPLITALKQVQIHKYTQSLRTKINLKKISVATPKLQFVLKFFFVHFFLKDFWHVNAIGWDCYFPACPVFRKRQRGVWNHWIQVFTLKSPLTCLIWNIINDAQHS